MAMRLREIEGRWVAVCAARTVAKAGDIYIDDNQDHAIRAKLLHDYRTEGLDMPVLDSELNRLMRNEEACSSKGT